MTDLFQKILDEQKRGPDGRIHPFFAWRPRLPQYGAEKGRLYYQEQMPKCRAFKVVACTANGVGKTEVLGIIANARSKGFLPFDTSIRWPTPQHGWVVTKARNVDNVFDRIVKFAHPKYVRRIYRGKGQEHIEYENGSTLRMMTDSMPPEAFEGANLSWAIVDEEIGPKHWLGLMSRLRLPGAQIYFGLTPINGTKFLYDELGMAQRERYRDATEGDIAIFQASSYDNDCLPESYLRQMEHECRKDPDMRRIRILGDYVCMAGKHIFENVIESARATVRDPIGQVVFGEGGEARWVQPDTIKTGAWDVWERPEPGYHYAIGADVSEGGIDGDYSAAFVISAATGEVVARFHGKIAPGDFGQDLYMAGRWYNTALLNWEMNMQGAAVCDRLMQLHYPKLALRDSFGGRVKTVLQTYGFRTDKNSKPSIIEDLLGALADGALAVRDEETVEELTHFGYARKESATPGKFGMEALYGHDDLVMALAIAWRTTKKVHTPYERWQAPKNFGDRVEEHVMKELRRSKGRRQRHAYG